jgi:hypothetical protein
MSAGPELILGSADGDADPPPETSSWGAETEEPTYRPDDPSAPPDVVTRLMCAATHLHASFADYVNAELLKVSYSAICPSWGVDHVALARHAVLSRRRRLARDRKLVRTQFGIAGAVLFVALLAWLGPLSFLMAVALELVVVIGGIAVAWGLIFEHYRAARTDALALVDGASVLESAPPLAPEVEERLSQLRDGNVVVFSGPTPFVGSGVYLDDWTMTLDLEPTVDPATGARRTPRPFDAAKLHRELLRTVPLGDLSDIRAANRVYVSGTHAPNVAEIVPPPVPRRQRPRVMLSEEELERIILEPQEGARVYACFEKTGWRGQIVVSMFVRAARYENTLFVEGASFVLLPLRAPFGDAALLPLRKSEELRAVAFTAATKAVPLLLGALGRRMRSRRGAREDREALEAIEELRDRHRDVDFGASKSIRSEAADSARSRHYASVDEFMYFLVLRRRVWTCMKEFLQRHDVDTDDLDRQVVAIVDRTGIFKARDLKSEEE